MKQLAIISVMCLSTLFAKAQVMTSETVNNVYASISAVDNDKFVYNGDYDDKGNMTEMTVCQKESNRSGQETMKPVCHYEYKYTADGLLESRIKYVWKKNQWQCIGRHDYSLDGNIYTAAYSRWNKKSSDFDTAVEKITYSLMPDNSISQISYYQCKHQHDTLQLAWQMPVINSMNNAAYDLTQK